MTPRRLRVVPPAPPDPPRWWQGWAPALLIIVLTGGLVYASGAAKQANANLLVLKGQLATQAALLEYGDQERARLQSDIDSLLAITPTETIVVEPCTPPRRREKRVVPVFARESQFSGVTR